MKVLCIVRRRDVGKVLLLQNRDNSLAAYSTSRTVLSVLPEYNRVRIHSANDYLSPAEFEALTETKALQKTA